MQASREVWCLADDATLLRLARSDQVADHHQSSRDAHTRLQWNACAEPGHCRDQLQPRTYCALRVVLMSFRIAKVHEHTVTHILGNKPAEAVHDLSYAFLIGRNDVAKVLRVHAGGECRRTDHVREHDRDLPALSRVLGLRIRSGGRFSK